MNQEQIEIDFSTVTSIHLLNDVAANALFYQHVDLTWKQLWPNSFRVRFLNYDLKTLYLPDEEGVENPQYVNSGEYLRWKPTTGPKPYDPLLQFNKWDKDVNLHITKNTDFIPIATQSYWITFKYYVDVLTQFDNVDKTKMVDYEYQNPVQVIIDPSKSDEILKPTNNDNYLYSLSCTFIEYKDINEMKFFDENDKHKCRLSETCYCHLLSNTIIQPIFTASINYDSSKSRDEKRYLSVDTLKLFKPNTISDENDVIIWFKTVEQQEYSLTYPYVLNNPDGASITYEWKIEHERYSPLYGKLMFTITSAKLYSLSVHYIPDTVEAKRYIAKNMYSLLVIKDLIENTDVDINKYITNIHPGYTITAAVESYESDIIKTNYSIKENIYHNIFNNDELWFKYLVNIYTLKIFDGYDPNTQQYLTYDLISKSYYPTIEEHWSTTGVYGEKLSPGYSSDCVSFNTDDQYFINYVDINSLIYESDNIIIKLDIIIFPKLGEYWKVNVQLLSNDSILNTVTIFKKVHENLTHFTFTRDEIINLLNKPEFSVSGYVLDESSIEDKEYILDSDHHPLVIIAKYNLAETFYIIHDSTGDKQQNAIIDEEDLYTIYKIVHSSTKAATEKRVEDLKAYSSSDITETDVERLLVAVGRQWNATDSTAKKLSLKTLIDWILRN